jgi:NAD(P)-dependent dehydrogenase (short-subunit alcohol dehydrogenase family)
MSTLKVALITGANKGIGKEIARGLGKKGFMVLIGSRDLKNGEAVAAQFKNEDIQAHVVELDVTQEASVQAAAKWIEARFGKLDVLVNNAGIIASISGPSEADIPSIEKTYQTNVFGPIRLTQAMLPLLKKADAARIVNVSSGLGSLAIHSDPSGAYGHINSLSYCSSKTALNAVTVLFAKELRGTPIKVNSVCPGHCDTDLNNHSGPRSPEQGAVVAIRFATLPSDGPSGGYFNEDGAIAW